MNKTDKKVQGLRIYIGLETSLSNVLYWYKSSGLAKHSQEKMFSIQRRTQIQRDGKRKKNERIFPLQIFFFALDELKIQD